ncbi:MAG TPA: hypothetical protein VI386_17750 [Candidatus Sulfotelmatobacter sp.]
MPILAEAKSTKQFALPKEGLQRAVLAEVRDLGLVDTTYKGVTKKTPKVLFRYQLEELDEEGQPKRLYTRMTLSLNEKAQLYKHIKQMFGKVPPATLDLEKLVGTNVQVVIAYNQVGDRTYTNIETILKPTPGAAKLEIVPIPKKDAAKQEVAAALKSNAIAEENPVTDEDIPY